MTTKRWLGSAAPVTDVWTYNLSGTVINQTYSTVINGKTVSYVAGASDTVATILAGLIAACSVSSIPEFQELTPSGVGSVGAYTQMLVTQNLSGRPTVISSATTTGAATFTVTNTTVATGPNFFDNSQNWSGGVAPVNSDTLVFDNGSIPCKYNINTSLTGVTLQVNPGYGGQLGLPVLNQTGSTPYAEYRTTYLTLAGGTVNINSALVNQCNIAFGANTATVRVLNTATQRPLQNIPIVLIQGGNSSSNLYITKGDVGTAFYQGQTATFSTIQSGYAAAALTDVLLMVGAGTTATTVSTNGGVITVSANCTTITQGLAGGSMTLTDAVAVTTLNAYGGTVNLNSTGTIGTLNLYGAAALNCDGDPRPKTISTTNVNSSGVTITDNRKSVNSGTFSAASPGITGFTMNHGLNTTIAYT